MDDTGALERRWRRTGAVDDEARLLAHRVRAGDLDRDDLRLAAYVGHEAARRALGGERWLQPPGQDGSLFKWVQGLEAWGKQAGVRAAVASARAVRDLLDRDLREIEVAEQWLLTGTGAPDPAAIDDARIPRGLDVELAGSVAAATPFMAAFRAGFVAEEADALLTQRSLGSVREAIRDALVPWALGYGDPPAGWSD